MFSNGIFLLLIILNNWNSITGLISISSSFKDFFLCDSSTSLPDMRGQYWERNSSKLIGLMSKSLSLSSGISLLEWYLYKQLLGVHENILTVSVTHFAMFISGNSLNNRIHSLKSELIRIVRNCFRIATPMQRGNADEPSSNVSHKWNILYIGNTCANIVRNHGIANKSGRKSIESKWLASSASWNDIKCEKTVKYSCITALLSFRKNLAAYLLTKFCKQL